MPAKRAPKPDRFSAAIAAAADQAKIIGIKAGRAPHRTIGVWVVVVEGRIFIRSWSQKPRSWWRTFLEEPEGVLELAGRKLRVRAVQTRSERLKDAVSRAYMEKYGQGGSVRYARDLGRPKSRETTTKLRPLTY